LIIQKTGMELRNKIMPVLNTYHETRSVMYNLEKTNRGNVALIQLLNDLRDELERLVPDTFVELYTTERLEHIVRYMKAVTIRVQRALVDFKKDQIKANDVKIFNESLKNLLETLSPRTSEEKRDAVEDFFWLIEEYKVSLFAQELRTPFPVSRKRMLKKLAEIERMV